MLKRFFRDRRHESGKPSPGDAYYYGLGIGAVAGGVMVGLALTGRGDGPYDTD